LRVRCFGSDGLRGLTGVKELRRANATPGYREYLEPFPDDGIEVLGGIGSCR
jgi:hypothetical protein